MTMILRADVRNVGGGEAVHHGDRQDAVLALQRLDAVDIAAHRLAAGREHLEHPAVEHRDVRVDLLPRHPKREVDHLLRPVGEVGMRHFLEHHEDVEGVEPRSRQMRVRVELGGDDRARPDDRRVSARRKSPSQSS